MKKKTYYNFELISRQTIILCWTEKKKEESAKKSHCKKYLEKLLECCLGGSLSKIERKMHLEMLLGILDFTSLK